MKGWIDIDRWLALIAELFFPTPRICPLCLSAQEKLMICSDCQRLIQRKKENHGQCRRCNTFGCRANVCDNCRNWPKYIKRNVSCWPYNEGFRELVLRFKYQQEPWLAQVLAAEMVKEINNKDIDLLIPVPLHSQRRRERGYNQSELLGKEIARLTGIPYECNVLVRVRNSPHQTGLSKEQRLTNLSHAFVVKHEERIVGKRVLVVDDVLTTGATMTQCARILKNKGVHEIIGLTLASGQR